MGKFAEALARSPPHYQEYYLNYSHLKEAISSCASDSAAARKAREAQEDQSARDLMDMLLAELRKVNHFACIKHEELFVQLRRSCEDCNSALRKPGSCRVEVLEELRSKIEALGDEIVNLDQYVRLNYMGFQKITRNLDAALGLNTQQTFVAKLHAEPFCLVRFDDILILLGLAWMRWRSIQSQEQSKDATWKPPESFVRNTAKYWVKPEKVTLLKTRILRELPYLIFNASVRDQEQLLDPYALLNLDYQGADDSQLASGPMEESQLLSSIYFDSLDGSCYQDRILRKEGARLVRFRWYGENTGDPKTEIYVERKVHHEGWALESSSKDRCVIPQSDIYSFMKGRFDIEGYFAQLAEQGVSAKAVKSMKRIADEVDGLMKERKLQPMIRTSYYRSAFQLATDNKVRISLDTQMTLLNEFQGDGHPTTNWCHVGSDYLREEDVYRFPFAILEIKLQNVAENPLWLQELLADIEAVQVHKFSKFQHAMAFLHPARVSIMPHWHREFQEWSDRRRTSGSKSLVDFASSSSLDSFPTLATATAPRSQGHQLKDLGHVDPKAILANERTLLHYAEKALYVSVGSGFLLKSGSLPCEIAGLVLVAITFGVVVCALVEYYERYARITKRGAVVKTADIGLGWARGPKFVTLLVAAILIASGVASLEGEATSWRPKEL